MSKTQFNTQKYPTVDLSQNNNKGRLIITDSFKRKVDMLHDIVGDIEWCGYLVYRHISGTMDNPSSVVIQAEDIFPMNIGSHSYTEAEANQSTMEFMDRLVEFERDETCQHGLIHTHHTMATFFSGTDNKELHDSVDCYKGGYFLSLIVNKTLDWKAKAVYLAEVETPSLVDAVIPNAVVNMPQSVRIQVVPKKTTYMFSMDFNVEVPNINEDTIACPFALGEKVVVSSVEDSNSENTGVEYIIQYERNGTITLRPTSEPAEDIELAGIRDRIEVVKEESKKTKYNYNTYKHNYGLYTGNNQNSLNFDDKEERQSSWSKQQSNWPTQQEKAQETQSKTKSSNVLLKRENILHFLASWLNGSFVKNDQSSIIAAMKSITSNYYQDANKWNKSLSDLKDDVIPTLLEYFDDDDILAISQVGEEADNPRIIIINRIFSELTNYCKNLGDYGLRSDTAALLTSIRNILGSLRSSDPIKKYISNVFGTESEQMISLYTIPSKTSKKNIIIHENTMKQNLVNYYNNNDNDYFPNWD